MAEYLIRDTTLDAIADAINTKTGGSSAMTPAEMVTAIGSISGGGGTAIQSGHFTPANADSTYSVIVDNEIASNPFVAIFSIDSETTPVNLGLIEGIFFVPDATIECTGTQISMGSNYTVFNSGVSRNMASTRWKPSTKTLTMSARGGSNFYAGSQYTYAIIPLTALVSVYR